jgi:hypothetical protein
VLINLQNIHPSIHEKTKEKEKRKKKKKKKKKKQPHQSVGKMRHSQARLPTDTTSVSPKIVSPSSALLAL